MNRSRLAAQLEDTLDRLGPERKEKLVQPLVDDLAEGEMPSTLR